MVPLEELCARAASHSGRNRFLVAVAGLLFLACTNWVRASIVCTAITACIASTAHTASTCTHAHIIDNCIDFVNILLLVMAC